MKIFLSHNMSDLTKEEVMKIREEAIKTIQYYYGTDIDIIDNYNHTNVPKNAGRLWHLGTSITQLDSADAIYFCEPYANSRGCEIERYIANLYNLKVLNKEIAIMGKEK